MVDFKKMMEQRKKAEPIKPYEIFKRLSPDKINDLWHSQQIILEDWFNRRNEKDLVIKLNTGGGKTLIGLLIAKSIVNESKGSVLYLCPTKQLVKQTVDKAKLYGIDVLEYTKESGIPIGFKSGKHIMISTYSALFNGLSKFGIEGDIKVCNVEGIIMDDAHTSESIIRDQFTIKINFNKDKEIYDEFIGLFREDFKEIERIALFDDIVDGKDSKVLEVPYWAWKDKENNIRDLLQRSSESFIFQWRLIRDKLKYCKCLISSKEINITPIYPLINTFPTFKECNKRIYMSATLSNDSTLIRTFDADFKSINNPIEVNNDVSMGERMMLAPSLMSIKDDSKSVIDKIIGIFSERYGVIVLVPYKEKSKNWNNVGRYAESSNEVLLQVDSMIKENNKGPFIWANRYDGIDLPEDTCRLLIISGLPGIMSCYDRYMASILNGSKLVNNIIAQRLEQGLGRATRGAGDYCVILFEGDDIVNWISEKSNLDLLSKSTRAQLEIGNKISKEIESLDELSKTISQCYDRESDWTSYHANTLADATDIKINNKTDIEDAGKERLAFSYYIHGDFESAKETLEELIKDNSDNKMISWYTEFLARVFYESGDGNRSNELQKKAYKANNQLNKPRTKIQYELLKMPSKQSEEILNNLKKYSLKRGFLSELNKINSKLNSASTANQFEDALNKLVQVMGFKCERPEYEYGEGPDALWKLDENRFLIIECKSKKNIDNNFNKKENGQLLDSYEWIKSKYVNCEAIKVSLHPTNFCTKGTHSEDVRVINFNLLDKLKSNVENFYKEICDLNFSNKEMLIICERLINKYKISSDYIISEYTTNFKIREK